MVPKSRWGHPYAGSKNRREDASELSNERTGRSAYLDTMIVTIWFGGSMIRAEVPCNLVNYLGRFWNGVRCFHAVGRGRANVSTDESKIRSTENVEQRS